MVEFCTNNMLMVEFCTNNMLKIKANIIKKYYSHIKHNIHAYINSFIDPKRQQFIALVNFRNKRDNTEGNVVLGWRRWFAELAVLFEAGSSWGCGIRHHDGVAAEVGGTGQRHGAGVETGGGEEDEDRERKAEVRVGDLGCFLFHVWKMRGRGTDRGCLLLFLGFIFFYLMRGLGFFLI